ncbi:hypothetical protein ACFWIQ_25550 [Kitasatospora sp. NPDC127059]|uniref:hypothetical protein n=1 Tax=Kitasatospora sp. NPDC127059 TaxID=3347120 RepID=UPI003651E507
MRARRSRSAVLTAATLGVLLATGAVVASPAAYAADAPAAATATATATAEPTAKATADKPSLRVDAPTTVGRGGQPVEFTETITNPGTTEGSYRLRIGTSGAGPVSTNAIKVDYRDADGTWKPVTGTAPGLTVAAGATKTVQLRLTTELATYWSNVDSTVTLSSAVLDAANGAVLAESTDQVAAKAISLQVKNAPTTAVVGGAPVEFDVVIGNASASGYTNVSKIVETDQHSTLQVQKADGSWQNLTPVALPHASGRVDYFLADDQDMAPHETFTRHVRLAYTADAPVGVNFIHPWAVLHQGGGEYTVGPQFIQVNLTSGPTLSVREPASVGNGGKPVEFSETVTNPGGTDASFTLKLDASNPGARSKDRITLEYRDADGTWKPVTLNFSQVDKTFDFAGEIPGVTVAAGATKTVQLRLATPVNNDWAAAGGTIKLHSALVDAGHTVVSETTKDVALKALDVQVKNAPTTAVIGGAPVEFDVTVNNSSASDYDNLSPVLLADQHSTLQVQKADGGWEDVTGTPSPQSGGPVKYHLTADKNLAANASVTKHVRLAFTTGATVGKTPVNAGVILAEGGPAMDAYVGPQGFQVDLTTAAGGAAVKAGFSTTDSGTTGTTSTTSTTGTTDGTIDTAQPVGGSLAHTGSEGVLPGLAAAAGLLVSGIGAVLFARRRRSA